MQLGKKSHFYLASFPFSSFLLLTCLGGKQQDYRIPYGISSILEAFYNDIKTISEAKHSIETKFGPFGEFALIFYAGHLDVH